MLLHRLTATAAVASLSSITHQWCPYNAAKAATSALQTVFEARSTSPCAVAGRPWAREGLISPATCQHHLYTVVTAGQFTSMPAGYAQCNSTGCMPCSVSGWTQEWWPYNRSMKQSGLGCRCSSTLSRLGRKRRSSKMAASNDTDMATERPIVPSLPISGGSEEGNKFVALKISAEDLVRWQGLSESDKADFIKYLIKLRQQQQLLGEQTFKAGDVLGYGRYKLLNKQLMYWQLQQHGHFKAAYERKSWDVMWNGLDLQNNNDVTIKVSESGAASVHKAAVQAAALHALAGDHPNILRVLDAFEQRTGKGRHVCVVMEPAGSDWTKVLKEFGGRAVDKARGSDYVTDHLVADSVCLAGSEDGIKALKAFARQLFTVLDYLHSHGIVHMDIQPSNILLDLPFEHRTTLGAKALEWAPDRFSLEGFTSFLQMFLSNRIMEQQVDNAAATVTGVYQEKNLHKATIKLTGFEKAVLYRPLVAAVPESCLTESGSRNCHPLSDNKRYNRDEQLVSTWDEYRAPESRHNSYLDRLQPEPAGCSRLAQLLGAEPVGFPLSCVLKESPTGSALYSCANPLQLAELLGYEDYAAPAYDIWRAGLTVFQLATSKPLFSRSWWRSLRNDAGHMLDSYDNDQLHLFDMVDTLGSLPREFSRAAPRFHKFYFDNDKLRISRVYCVVPAQHDVSKLLPRMTNTAVDKQQAEQFHAFITSILVLQPSKRPTAAEVLKHPWLQDMPDKHSGPVQ